MRPRLLLRAPNWLGDAVMSLPAIAAIRQQFPSAHLTVLARPSVAELYLRDPTVDAVLTAPSRIGWSNWRAIWQKAKDLRQHAYQCAVLFPNSFESALLLWLAAIPERVGYRRDGRGWMLTRAIPTPRPGEIPPHQAYYYLELIRRAGWIAHLPQLQAIELTNAEEIRQAGYRRWQEHHLDGPIVGVSPGAAYGSAKRWSIEGFAKASARLARNLGATVAIFGSASDAPLGECLLGQLSKEGIPTRNYCGRTSLGEFMELLACCRVLLSNDSGAMHLAAALGVPTVAVFGPTDPKVTGPLGRRCHVIQHPVSCAPCKHRECPIDHRCMRAIQADEVAEAALQLLK